MVAAGRYRTGIQYAYYFAGQQQQTAILFYAMHHLVVATEQRNTRLTCYRLEY